MYSSLCRALTGFGIQADRNKTLVSPQHRHVVTVLGTTTALQKPVYQECQLLRHEASCGFSATESSEGLLEDEDFVYERLMQPTPTDVWMKRESLIYS